MTITPKRNLGNWMRAYMEFTRETESPDAYHFWTGLTLISSVVKRKIWFQMNQFQIYPNLFTILVGPSGARKSIAAGIGVGLVSQLGIKKFADKVTGAALIRALAEGMEKEIISDEEVRLVSPLLIYSSELGVFLGVDAYKSGIIADLTDLYDCPPKWEKDLISRDKEIIVAPYVTMLAASTPQTLKDVLPVHAMAQGFTSRVMFIWGGGRRKKVPIPPWGVEYEMLKKYLLADLERIGKLAGTFSFSPDGAKAYNHYYINAPEPEEEFEDETLRGYASRKSTHILKAAMLLSLADKDELIITEKDFGGAIDAIKWMESGLPQVFAGHGNAATAQDTVRIYNQILVATRRIGFTTLTELVKRNYSHLSAQELGHVLDTLKAAGAIEEIIAKDPRTAKLCQLFKVINEGFIAEDKKPIPRRLAETND